MLETLDLTRKLERAEYIRQLARRQIQLRELGWQVYRQKRSVVIVFEGWDAAGKGGVIKRITAFLNPRTCRVVAVPTPGERERPTPARSCTP